ncbi:MAG: diguanylate cyclase [Campylobacterales bacterium]|nr:diguanylate cyclase [Campylobacterales bacterium]
MKSFKARAQTVITLVVIAVSAALTFYHISQEKRYISERTERASEGIRRTFESIVKDTEQQYRFRTYATLNAPGVMEAFKARDNETLYRLILPRYQALRVENPYLTIMQFHAADGHSILRVHMKAKYGDDIAARRPMLREIHAGHQLISGFEGGLGGIAFRVIVPIVDQGVYVGALEYGIDTGYFVKKIKNFAGSDSVMMIHKEWLGAADRDVYSQGIGQYYYSTILEERKDLLESFARQNPYLEPRHVQHEGKSFEINPLFLKDSKNRNVGIIISTHDVTGTNQNIIDTLIGSSILTLLLAALLWGLFEYAFRTLVGKLMLQEQYIDTILDSQKNLVIVTDGQEIIYANRAFFDYFHIDSLEWFRQKHQCVCAFFESSPAQEYLQPQIDGVTWTEYLIRHSEQENRVKMTMDGKTSIFTVHSKKMEYQGQIRHVVVFTDITNLNELATQDMLTKLANRFQFDKVLEHSIHLAIRHGNPLSMLLIDIDHFKDVNDRYGHLVGDEVLKTLAKILTVSVRKSDVVARWGGEELVILLPDSELASAVKLAELLRQKIEKHEFPSVGRVTCSIGVVQWREGENTDTLFHRADEKLYVAKEGGRNRVVS